MKITKTQLKQIIKEEIENTITEIGFRGMAPEVWAYDKDWIEYMKNQENPWDLDAWKTEFISTLNPHLNAPNAEMWVESLVKAGARNPNQEGRVESVYKILAKRLYDASPDEMDWRHKEQ